MIGMILASVWPPYFRMTLANWLISPVRSNPAPRIITAIIEITAFEENPSKRRVGSARLSNPGTCDKSPSAIITRMAEKSIRKTSVTKSRTVTTRMASTTIISAVRTMSNWGLLFGEYFCTSWFRNHRRRDASGIPTTVFSSAVGPPTQARPVSGRRNCQAKCQKPESFVSVMMGFWWRFKRSNRANRCCPLRPAQ